MPDTLIKVDLASSPTLNENIHNRWHPDLPMVAMVKPGASFRVECVDWTGAQIAADDDIVAGRVGARRPVVPNGQNGRGWVAHRRQL